LFVGNSDGSVVMISVESKIVINEGISLGSAVGIVVIVDKKLDGSDVYVEVGMDVGTLEVFLDIVDANPDDDDDEDENIDDEDDEDNFVDADTDAAIEDIAFCCLLLLLRFFVNTEIF